MLRDYMRKPGSKEKNTQKTCRFCEIIKKKEDMIFEDNIVFVMINQSPYKEGHILILPKRHVVDLRELNPEESESLFKKISFMLGVLEDTYETKSFNIGCNICPPAGSTYEHLHFQIIPRWVGDSGFMEVFADTRVMKESPQKTKERIIESIKSLNKK